jgi:hypothetical protein
MTRAVKKRDKDNATLIDLAEKTRNIRAILSFLFTLNKFVRLSARQVGQTDAYMYGGSLSQLNPSGKTTEPVRARGRLK